MNPPAARGPGPVNNAAMLAYGVKRFKAPMGKFTQSFHAGSGDGGARQGPSTSPRASRQGACPRPERWCGPLAGSGR
jgi:hypothetical protein